MADIVRKIDRKHHIDSQGRIVKTGNNVPISDDEPTILFRARDHLAVKTLEHYRALCIQDGCLPEHIIALQAMIESFQKFAKDHPEAMKQPGITRGA